MGEIFATTSGKGGVGKSATAVGLGLAFAGLNKKTLLVDMDEGLRCLDLLLGVDSKAVLDLGDAVKTEEINDIAYECSQKNLFLIPAPDTFGEIAPEALTAFAKKAEELYDVVIFDFPAGLQFELYSALPKKTLFLGIATPDPVSVRDIAAVGEKLASLGLNSRLIINRFSFKIHKKKFYQSIDGIIDASSIRLLGIVPEAEDVNTLSINHKLKRNSNASKAFLRIAERLQYKNIPLKNLKKI
ncbi:MAG: AAA family ATPase [Clostridia bacterium]|nr:AAA family ATPase [Clostridia bacterium]